MRLLARPTLALALLGLSVFVTLAGCRALQVSRVDAQASDGWVTEGDAVHRRNAVAAAVEPPLEEVWIYNAAAGFGPGSPLILGGTILVSTRKGEVHAIDLATGKKGGLENFGDSVEGTPVVQEGRLFVPVAGGRRALYAYDLTRGDRVWNVKGPAVEAGLLPLGDAFVAVDAAAVVRKYDNRDGAVRWERPLGEALTVHATPVMAGGHVVVADDRGGLVALDPREGTVRWTQALRTPVYTAIAADAATLYVPTTRGRFFAVDAAQGRVRWRFAVPDTTVRFSAPAVGGEVVIFGASDGTLRALEAATGRLRWSFDAGAALAAAPLLTAETVYVGSMGQKLIALDRQTGTLKWEQELKGRVKSALAARGGYLVVLTEPRFVYLFKSTSAISHVATQ